MIDFRLGEIFEQIVLFIQRNFHTSLRAIRNSINGMLDLFTDVLTFPHPLIMAAIFAAIAWRCAGKGLAAFAFFGMALIYNMTLWEPTMSTLAMVLSAVLIALVLGVPLGILMAKSSIAEKIMRPLLDFMQTLPAFVYLIPMVMLFSLGAVSGIFATLIFALPPAVRLTNLGIRQVPEDIRDAATAFGSTPGQMLFKAEIPVAAPTIMAGVNQTIMLALSMVVIAGLIGAGGLGEVVNRGLTQARIDVGFEGGLSIVILAIYLDRVTQTFGRKTKTRNP